MRLWREVPKRPGVGQQDDDDDEEDGEEKIRNYAQGVLLSAEEKGGMMQVHAASPDRVEWKRAVEMFWRRSNARSEEVHTCAIKYSMFLDWKSVG